MKILTVSFFDDNFGDMLVRICSDRLVTVALKNLGFDEADCVIDNMHIKEVDEEKIASADLILFSGGAMFGFNSLGTYDAIDAITALACEKNIPVVFSSLGINNTQTDEESGARLNEILRRKCVKAMSVRESAEVFAPYAKDCDYEIVSVCDPAVWAMHVYRREIQEVRSVKTGRIVGLNVVRGGLFKANGENWTLDDEENYLKDLIALYDENGIDYRLFTNGSVLDYNSMGYIARRIGVSDEKLISPDCSREVVRTVAGFDAVVAFRMHAAILSYSMDIPSVNLIWNEKIPCFYRNIGYPDRAVPLRLCTPEVMLRKTQELLDDSEYKSDEAFLMSLYDYLYTTLGAILKKPAENRLSFAEVCHLMGMPEIGVADDVPDYRAKLRRGQYCYRALFDADMERRREIKSLKKQVKDLKKQLTEAQKQPAQPQPPEEPKKAGFLTRLGKHGK